MKRITGRLLDEYGTAYVKSETGTEGVGAFTTHRRLPEIISRLAAYEDTGFEPKEIEHLAGIASEHTQKVISQIDELLDKPKPETHFEEIKQMKAEELAEFLATERIRVVSPIFNIIKNTQPVSIDIFTLLFPQVKKTILEWLESEVSNDTI